MKNNTKLTDYILNSIETLVDAGFQKIKVDQTFVSVVKHINPNGTYTIQDISGADRNVKCAIPNVELKVGKNVWVKIPRGNLNQMHICGIM